MGRPSVATGQRCAARVTELVEALERWTGKPDRDRLFEAVLPEIRSLTSADCAAAFSMEPDAKGTVRLAWSCASEFPPQALSAFRAIGERGTFRWAYDPLRPGPQQANRAVHYGDLTRLFGQSRATLVEMNSVWREYGLDRADMLRVQLCDGSAHLAWVGALREGSFSDDERDLLQALVPALQRRLRLERLLHELTLARASLEQVLEHLGSQALIVDSAHRVHFASASARAMLLPQWQAGSLPPDVIRLRLEIPGLPMHEVLLAQRGPSHGLTARLEGAARRFELTRRERDVLQHVCEGRANKSIADLLACSVKTVEVHVSAILRKSGVDSRSALVAEVLRPKVR